MKKQIKIVKDELNPESTELLAKSIVQVAEASETLLNSGLTMRALEVLLQDKIGSAKISKQQIRLVLENLPRLKGWYCK
jgi:hypothetical protein